ncbi:MAG: metalloregulator ArsR/SmtB family transcription factor [Ectothiorhodospiraceae bacterium]|jgi:DNA-binding transcriptional ArsR family regulator
MSNETNVPSVASLIADPTRWAMLLMLLDGKALPAGELAYAAGVTAQTASAHLSKLLNGGVLQMEQQGRHRYYRLAGDHVADALEGLAAIRPRPRPRRRALSRNAYRLRFARCCYNHLAGQLGVGLTRALVTRGFLAPAPDKRFEITAAGTEWFSRIGVDVSALPAGRRGTARQCLDWTERDHHLAGPLGVELLTALVARGWLRRSDESRALHLTPKGRAELQRRLDITFTPSGDVAGAAEAGRAVD